MSGANEERLTASREEMYGALDLFYKHVQHTISLMFAIIAGISVVVGLVARNPASAAVLLGPISKIAAAALWVAAGFGAISIFITGRYYGLYVSALVFAAHEHAIQGVTGPSWFTDVRDLRTRVAAELGRSPLRCRGRLYRWIGRRAVRLGGADADERRVERVMRFVRTYGPPHTWFLYALLIVLITLAALLGGLWVWRLPASLKVA